MYSDNVSHSLTHILGRISKALGQSGSTTRAVTLVGASKTIPKQILRGFIEAGLRHFGENRVQEAVQKWPSLKHTYPHVRLHLIGPLQTNKVKDALDLFDVIETVDRGKLVDQLAKGLTSESAKKNIFSPTFAHSPVPSFAKEFFIQINTGEEPQKGGVAPQHADALIAYAQKKGLNVTGLMCVPPAGENPEPHFALLREIAHRTHLPNLSMGMSGDFETAIRCGATHVRIGTALFGERKISG